VIDGAAAADSDRKFVSIFDIVDRKVWLAVGGVFRDATAPVAFIVEGAGVRVRCNAAVGNAESG